MAVVDNCVKVVALTHYELNQEILRPADPSVASSGARFVTVPARRSYLRTKPEFTEPADLRSHYFSIFPCRQCATSSGVISQAVSVVDLPGLNQEYIFGVFTSQRCRLSVAFSKVVTLSAYFPD